MVGIGARDRDSLRQKSGDGNLNAAGRSQSGKSRFTSAHASYPQLGEAESHTEVTWRPQVRGMTMREVFGGLLWLGICTLSILVWWPVLVVILEYWVTLLQ